MDFEKIILWRGEVDIKCFTHTFKCVCVCVCDNAGEKIKFFLVFFCNTFVREIENDGVLPVEQLSPALPAHKMEAGCPFDPSLFQIHPTVKF